MLIQDFKVKPRPLPRVRLHPHFACQDCRYVKEVWNDNLEFRKAIVLNGIKPCKSVIKSRLLKEKEVKKKTLLEVLLEVGEFAKEARARGLIK